MAKLFKLENIRAKLNQGERGERKAGFGSASVAGTDKGIPAEISCLSLRAARDRAEIAVLSAALDRSGRNVARASEMLGVSRPTLYDLMKKHGL